MVFRGACFRNEINVEFVNHKPTTTPRNPLNGLISCQNSPFPVFETSTCQTVKEIESNEESNTGGEPIST